MQYRVNPKNGDRLSALGFGCMRFGGEGLGNSFTGRFDRQKAERLIKLAIDSGINYFDTAYMYAGSEEVLGAALAKYGERDKVYIATKMPLILCRSRGDFDKYFSKHLERLQTDYIDYYLLHMLTGLNTWNALHEWGIEEWAAKKKKARQIKQFGFSFHGAQDEFLSLLDAYDWDFVQIQYNYSDENYQAGVTGLKKAAAKGLPVMIMEPLLGGKLVSGLPKAAAARFKTADANLTPAAWAFRWLYNQPEITVVLSGMNEQAQLDENIKTADTAAPGMLTQAELDAFADVKRIFNDSYKVHCTGCHYCMPCPHGVNIPACFTAYNTRHAISKSQAALQYSMTTLMNDKPSYASLCKKCGKCEKHCPQNIPIRRTLDDVVREFETFRFRVMRFGTKFFVRKRA
jgi:predicted aldo/keto reductase-like oxidoreductase